MVNDLFRGKNKKNSSQWIYGSLVVANDTFNEGKHYIIDGTSDFSYGDNGNRIRIGCFKEVVPETVGRSFIYKDGNGQMIYDKDIVQFTMSDGYSEKYLLQWVDEGQEFQAMPINDNDEIVKYGDLYFYNFSHDNILLGEFILMVQDAYGDFDETYGGKVEIIGNIYDNPEMIKASRAYIPMI